MSDEYEMRGRELVRLTPGEIAHREYIAELIRRANSAPVSPDETFTREELAEKLKISLRGLDDVVSSGKVTPLLWTRKLVRFRWGDVLDQLRRTND